jgi:hypothetical protein
VYVGGYGYERPVWAVDPLTGQDTSWAVGFEFLPQSGTYGDYTQINAMLLDEGRLFFAGRFSTSDARRNVAAVDADSGAPSSWRYDVAPYYPTSLTRVGPAIVVAYDYSGPIALASDSAARMPFNPPVFGHIRTLALAPEGVAIGGTFDGIGGTPRAGLASINLDTGGIEPWTSTLVSPYGFVTIQQLATDGTWLFARTSDGRVAKIDPVSGAVLAERTMTPINADLARMVVAGGEIAIVTQQQVPELGLITVADWSYRVLPLTMGGYYSPLVQGLAVDGDTIYLSGSFETVNGEDRPRLAALDRVTGAVLPWRPAPDASPVRVAAAGGRVWAGGSFLRIGGERRRGLAELDPATGAALPWNPDVAGVFDTTYSALRSGPVSDLVLTPGGQLHVAIGGYPVSIISASDRPTVGGQATGYLVAFSTATGQRLPWHPDAARVLAATPDCLLVTTGCLPSAVPPPANLRVTQADASITLTWDLESSGGTGVRVEVGSREGAGDLASFDLPAGTTTLTGVAPTGTYFARVRVLAGPSTSPPSREVSFSVGSDTPGAPLDSMVVVDGTTVTLTWQHGSTGPPQAYELEVGGAEGRRDAVIPLSGTTTSYTTEAPLGFYWARVVARNGASRSAPGQELLVAAALQQRCGVIPLPPTNLAASVSGGIVSLTWGPPADGPQVDLQRVVAGSAPGLSDLATFNLTMSATSFATAAPPGIYFVRVISDNQCLSTASSNEVRVVVP